MLNWEEHKKFIIVTVGVVLVFLLVYLIIIAPARRATAEAKSQSELVKKEIDSIIGSGEVKEAKSIENLERERERLAKKLSELKQRMIFKPEPVYLGKGKIEFYKLLQESQRRLAKLATSKGITMPTSFGFPTGDIPVENLPRYFERLDIIVQVIDLAIACDLTDILSVGQEQDIHNFLPGVNLANDFTKYETVVIKLQGSFKSISDFLYKLLVAPRFLSLIRVSLENDDPNVDSIKLTLAVGGLKTR